MFSDVRLTYQGQFSQEGSGLPITQAAKANQNVPTNIPCKKPPKVVAMSGPQAKV